MDEQKELFATIVENEALMNELMQAWKQGASAQEIVALLASKGVEAPLDQVEALLARAQNEQAGRIESEELDIDELNRMAGGGNGLCEGTANCDKLFSARPDVLNRCTYSNKCDQLYMSVKCDKNFYT